MEKGLKVTNIDYGPGVGSIMVPRNMSNGTVKSDQTLLDLLDVLNEGRLMGVTEISDELGVSKSAAHKHLKTLAENGYVINEGGKYKLSLKLLELGASIRSNHDLCGQARPIIRELADETNELVAFSVEQSGWSVFVYTVNDRYGLVENLPLIGSHCYMHQNAAGKAMIAELSDEAIAEIVRTRGLPGATENSITTESELQDEIAEIRDQDYAVSFGERSDALRSVGVSITVPESDLLGAVSIAGPAKRLSRADLTEEYAPKIQAEVNDLELQLRYE